MTILCDAVETIVVRQASSDVGFYAGHVQQ